MAGVSPDAFFGGTQPNRAENKLTPLSNRGVTADQFFKVGTTPPIRAPFKTQKSRWSPQAFLEGAQDVSEGVIEGSTRSYYGILTALGRIAPDDPNYTPAAWQDDPFAETRALNRQKEVAERQGEQAGRAGFLDSLRNPLDSMANDGITSAAIRAGGGPVGQAITTPARFNERQAVEQAEQLKLQARQRILANPDKYPAATVELARAAQTQYEVDEAKTVLDKGGEIVDAISHDPAKMGAELINSVTADPFLIAAPAGMGTKPIQAARTISRLSPVIPASGLAKVDNILDAAITGASANLAVEAGLAQDQLRDLTPEDAAIAVTMGAVLSAGPAALFQRGAKARDTLKGGKGKLNEGQLESLIRDAEAEQTVAETVVDRPQTIRPDLRAEIEQRLGISNLTPAQKKAAVKARRAELRDLFKNLDVDDQYWLQRGEIEANNVEALARAETARAERGAAELARQQTVAREMAEDRAQRVARYDQEFEAALAQRAEQEAAGEYDAAVSEDALRASAARANQEDILEAAIEGRGIPEVARALNRARTRDQKVWRPKNQRGEVDPALLVRLGLATGLGTGAYALAEEDYRLGATFAATLAGILLPGGGRIGDLAGRLRQAGVVSTQGDILSMAGMVKDGKLKPEKDIQAQMVLDNENIAKAIAGDQRAFTALYNEYYPAVYRYIKNNLGPAAGRVSVDPEDVASMVLTDFFQRPEGYAGNVPLGAYLSKIAQNKITDVKRTAQTAKRGKGMKFESLYSESQEFESGQYDLNDDGDVVDVTSDNFTADTQASSLNPEQVLMREAAERQQEALKNRANKVIEDVLLTLNDRKRQSAIMSRVEGYTAQEIAELTDQNLSTVLMQIKSANDAIAEALAKLGRGEATPKPKADVAPSTEVKRGRGRPRKEVGEVDPRLLAIGAAGGLGGMVGAYLAESDDKSVVDNFIGAGIGALMLGGLGVRLKGGKTVGAEVLQSMDQGLGAVSTRIKNISEPAWRRTMEHGRNILKDTHRHLTNVDPFLVQLSKLPKGDQDIISRAILTGKPGVTDKLLALTGDKDLIQGWKQVRQTLDSLKDQLVDAKRINPSKIEYFPRMVIDLPGLLKAIGKSKGEGLEKILFEADTKSKREAGRPLDDLERSIIVNRYLAADHAASQKPGFARNRGVEEITPELQQFYATPAESLHSYIRSAVEDIETAKFFGKNLVTVKDGSTEHVNVDKSIGALVQEAMDTGRVTADQANELREMYESLFVNSKKAGYGWLQGARNLSYAGLLGNPASAAVQLGDVVVQAYMQGLMPTIGAVIKTLTNRKLVDMRDFGLEDHISQEFVGTGWTTKALNGIFKASLFNWADRFGKDVALNAAVINFAKMAKTEKGIANIQRKYGEALAPGEMNQLIKDLQNGDNTDLVRSIAFAELSRTQPITRMEMPQAYLNNPNGRVLYMLKSFTLKQIDVVRREAYDEIKKGNWKQGAKNLANLAITMSVAGVSTEVIRDVILNRDVDLDAKGVAFALLKTYALSEYFVDQATGVSKEEARERRRDGQPYARQQDAKPLQAVASLASPPIKMWEEILTADKDANGNYKLWRYVPVAGPFIHEANKEEAK